jgi:hypothetical protein
LLGNDNSCNECLDGDGFTLIQDGSTSLPSYSGSALPPGAIVPTEQPIVVGEGVTVTAPAQ